MREWMPEAGIFESELVHIRRKPSLNQFKYKVYHFFLDLDELENLSKVSKLLSYEKWGVFRFRQKDHLKFYTGYEHLSVKERLKKYLSENNISFIPQKVFLLTHLRIFNYVFNPVSLYYCYDSENNLGLVIAEVNNTYLEQKGYIIDLRNSKTRRQTKNFYVSPFIHHNCIFEFSVSPPDKKLFLNINSRNESTNEIILTGTLKGCYLAIDLKNLIYMGIKYPLLTFKVITMIHWQALKLFMKKNSYFQKDDVDMKIRQDLGVQNKDYEFDTAK